MLNAARHKLKGQHFLPRRMNISVREIPGFRREELTVGLHSLDPLMSINSYKKQKDQTFTWFQKGSTDSWNFIPN